MLEYKKVYKQGTGYFVRICTYMTNDADDDIWETDSHVFKTSNEAWNYIKTVLYKKELPFMINPSKYMVVEESYIIPESIRHVFTDAKNKMIYVLSDEQYKDMMTKLNADVEKYKTKKQKEYFIKNDVVKQEMIG